MQGLLGLPLDMAEARLQAAGVAYDVIRSIAPPRRGQEDPPRELTPRVVRVSGSSITVCGFPDGTPGT